MIQIKNIVLGAFLIIAVAASAQDSASKAEVQKVKDSVKMDVRHLGKVSNTTTTTTTRRGYRKKKKDEADKIKPVADSLIVKETIVKKDDSIRQVDMPLIEADKVKTE